MLSAQLAVNSMNSRDQSSSELVHRRIELDRNLNLNPDLEELVIGTTVWAQKEISTSSTTDDLEYISYRCPKLKSLSFKNLRYLEYFTRNFYGLSTLDFFGLTFLHLSNCETLSNFKLRAPLLQRLELLDNPALKSIQVRIQFSTKILVRSPFPKIDIERTSLEDSDLEKVKDAPLESVEFLDLSYCQKITDAGLKQLTNLRPDKLSLRGCKKLTTAGIANLLSHITGLLVGLIKSIDLGELPQLKLGSVFDLPFSLSNACHIDLSDHSEPLDALFFNDPGVRPVGLAKAERLSGYVESLSVSNCSRLTDPFFHSLYNLKSLRELRANHLPLLTDLGLKGLIRTALVKLSIAKCKQITDAGLKALEPIKTLRMLNVKGCPQVTLRGVGSLTKAIPGIQILHDLDSATH